MPALPYRLIVDTNVLLRGLINIHSASGQIVDACDKLAVLILLSKPVLAEYRSVLQDPKILRYPELTREKTETVLRRLRYTGELIRSTAVRFEYRRDPRDAKWVELAIAGGATHVVSMDKDLLSLPTGHEEAAKRFRQRLPAVKVLDPYEFVLRHGHELGPR